MAVVEAGQMYFVRTDHIGRPIFATDTLGTKVWEASYLPFGGVQTSTGNASELRFPGQWFQAETGLHQNWMRDYDPTIGRYLQPDPLGLIDGASVYGYALQNPGRYTDSTGEFAKPIIGFGVGFIFNGGFQVATNWWYGMSIGNSFRCVDLSAAFIAGAYGGAGAGAAGFLKARQFAAATGVIATGKQANLLAPTIYAAEPECGCEIPEMPRWVDWVREMPFL